MADLIPVEGNPFEVADKTLPDGTPITDSTGPTLVPVEHNPFEAAPEKRSYGEDVQRLINDPVGVAVEDVKGIPNQLYEGAKGLWTGAKALGRRVVDDVEGIASGKPQQAAADVATLATKLNPLLLTRDLAKWAAENPGDAARVIADPAHPVQSIANLVTAGSGGALTAGRGALKLATTGARAADEVAGHLVAAPLSGVGRVSQRAAFRAGEAGGAEGAAFTDAMRGRADPMAISDRAMNAADMLAADKNAARNADAAQWAAVSQRVPVADIQQALADAHLANTTTTTGTAINEQAKAALDAIGNVLEKHTTFDPGIPGVKRVKFSSLPVEDADKLKQGIGEILYDKNMAPQGTPASVHAGKVYQAAVDAITKVSPKYAEAMERNQANIRNLRAIRGELSLKRDASPATVLGKLQSAMRNDVSSRFGVRGKFLDQLATKDPTLPASVAGQDFSSWKPRGLALPVEMGAGMGAAMLGHASSLMHPGAIAAILAAIPRIQGEARYAAGSMLRGARSAGITQRNIGLSLDALRMLGQQQAR